MNRMQATSILVIEDEPGIAENICYALETEGMQHHWLMTGQEALEALSRNRYDLILLDIGIPDISGFDLFRKFRESSAIPVIFLTARGEEIDRVAGLEMGADYIVKPFSPRELTARIRAVLRRLSASSTPSPGPSPSTIKETSAKLLIDDKRKLISFYGQTLSLSKHEFQLLRVLIQSPGRVYSREELLHQAWDEPEASFDRTIDAHIKNIRAKMKSINAAYDPITTHRGLGYSLKE